MKSWTYYGIFAVWLMACAVFLGVDVGARAAFICNAFFHGCPTAIAELESWFVFFAMVSGAFIWLGVADEYVKDTPQFVLRLSDTSPPQRQTTDGNTHRDGADEAPVLGVIAVGGSGGMEPTRRGRVMALTLRHRCRSPFTPDIGYLKGVTLYCSLEEDHGLIPGNGQHFTMEGGILTGGGEWKFSFWWGTP